MTEQTQRIRKFICQNIDLSSAKLTNLVVEKFSISRQAVNVHLQNLLKEKVIQAKKKGKFITYSLKPIIVEKSVLPLQMNYFEFQGYRTLS